MIRAPWKWAPAHASAFYDIVAVLGEGGMGVV
jgi:hypothetical protein